MAASKRIRFVLTALLILSLSIARAGDFEDFELETFAGDDFEFPNDMNAPTLNVVFLAIGADQDNGTWQGEALLEWHAALESQGAFNDQVLAWHFPVVAGAPFFVKGLIRGGMSGDYEGKIPLEQGGAIFVKKAKQFADPAGLPVDGQPTIVLVTPDFQMQEIFRGEVSDEGVAEILAAVSGYLPATE